MMKTALVLSGGENPMTLSPEMLVAVAAMLLALSCSSPSEPASMSDMDAVRAHRAHLCATFDPQTVERCDRITFVALMSAACGKDYNLATYEENGKWNRDPQPCYPAESKSECSLDGYLSVLHAAHTLHLPIVPRMRDTLERTNWLCGEGPEGVTSIQPLRSVIEHMTGSSFVGDADASVSGFRGHLLASYMWLRHRVGMSTIPGTYLALQADIPQSPLFPAMNGDTSRAVDRLMGFPAPYSQFWGSAPDSVIYAWSVSILENP